MYSENFHNPAKVGLFWKIKKREEMGTAAATTIAANTTSDEWKNLLEQSNGEID